MPMRWQRFRNNCVREHGRIWPPRLCGRLRSAYRRQMPLSERSSPFKRVSVRRDQSLSETPSITVRPPRASDFDGIPRVRIRPISGWAMLPLREIWEFRDLLIVLGGRDVKLRYKQTAIGVAWVIFQPLLAA